MLSRFCKWTARLENSNLDDIANLPNSEGFSGFFGNEIIKLADPRKS
jgi:hypothetical protein